MKKLLTFATGIFLCCIFSGCPYQSGVPIDQPREKINQNLPGTWNEEHYQFQISKLDEFTYLYRPRNRFTNEIDDTSTVYTTTINGTIFLNAYNYKHGATPEKYTLYKLEWIGKKQIKIYPVTEDIKNQFSTSDSLKTFIAGNMKREGFFEGPWILTRVK